jgi:hypothetical protein
MVGPDRDSGDVAGVAGEEDVVAPTMVPSGEVNRRRFQGS